MSLVTARQRKAAERALAPVVELDDDEDFSDLSKSELKALAELRGLSTSGNKTALIERLEA